MPRATTSTDIVRHPLETAPPDGYVELKPMDYGTYLKRRDMAMKMGVTGSGSGLEKIDLDILQARVTLFEFKSCIAGHNLEDAEGRTLNLATIQDFQMLDPKIGQEISALIDGMTQWESPKSSGGDGEGTASGDNVSEDSED